VVSGALDADATDEINNNKERLKTMEIKDLIFAPCFFNIFLLFIKKKEYCKYYDWNRQQTNNQTRQSGA